MKIGCCASLWEDLILALPSAGADYAEAGFSTLVDHTLEEIAARGKELQAAGVTVETMNLLFPSGIPLTGPAADFSVVDRYLEETLPKAAALGVKVVVFGSGGNRRVPVGFSHTAAFEQLVALCRDHMGPAMGRFGITCCVEPLNRRECNILTTSQECFHLVQAADHPHVRLLVDLYHFDLEGESLSVLESYGDCLQHLHIASAKHARQIPAPDDGEDYLAFFQALKAAGYTGRVSLEGSMEGGIPQIRESIGLLRFLAEEAGL